MTLSQKSHRTVAGIACAAMLLVAACAKGGADEADSGVGLDLDTLDARTDLGALDANLDAASLDLGNTDSGGNDAAMADLGTMCGDGLQDNDGNGTCMPACGSSGVCTGMLGCDDTSGTALCNTCPVTPGSRLAWSMVPPGRADWDTPGQIMRIVDNRPGLASFAWTRVGYCLVLNADVAYVEMDDYTAHLLSRVDLPIDWVYDQAVGNLTVRTNASSVTPASSVDTGYIEMWSNCYSAGADGLLDSRDLMDSAVDCYGSFQVHNGTATVIAWNGWSYEDGDTDIGIGNQSGSPNGTDWTAAHNAAGITTRRLEAYLVP